MDLFSIITKEDEILGGEMKEMIELMWPIYIMLGIIVILLSVIVFNITGFLGE